MILPQFFWFPRKIFLIWKNLSVHIKKQQIFFREIRNFWNYSSQFCDRRSFYDHSQNIWSMITHNHDWQKLEKYDLWSLMIVIWSEMIGDHDSISPTLFTNLIPNIGGSTFFKAYFLLRIASKISSFKIMGFFLPSILEQDLDLGFFNSCFHGKNLKRM